MEAAAPIILRPLLLAHLSPRSNPIKCSSSIAAHRARLFKLAAVADDTNSSSSSRSSEEASPPFDGVEIRFRRGSRRRYKEDVEGSSRAVETKDPPKTWEEMSLNEKAVELYVGEKGLLFWLNKFAYASIFIMIGVWILFRFVGPALNLYQLDTPPLAPTSVFKGA